MIALVWTACAEDPSGTGSLDRSGPSGFACPATSLTNGAPEDCDPTAGFADLGINAVDVGCDPTGTVLEVDLLAGAWTGTGRLLVVDGVTGRAELHIVETWSWDPCGAWDELRARVSVGSTYQIGGSTAFGCDDVDAEPQRLTMATWVTRYLDPEDIADCVLWGPDSDSVRAGDYDALLASVDRLPRGSLADCRAP